MCSAENRSDPLVLELMTTSGCHLCDQAVDVIVNGLDGRNFTIDLVDIAFDDALMDRYAVRIPVLVCPQQTKELAWPFDSRQLSDFANDLLTAGVAPC